MLWVGLYIRRSRLECANQDGDFLATVALGMEGKLGRCWAHGVTHETGKDLGNVVKASEAIVHRVGRIESLYKCQFNRVARKVAYNQSWKGHGVN